MKTQLVTIMVLLVVLLAGCKTIDPVSKERRVTRITQKVESGNFEFIAEKAPLIDGFHSVGSSYFIRVSKEKIEVDLPFFGRIYRLPSAIAGEAIKFTSSDFKYEFSKNKDGESWNAMIYVYDNHKRYRIFLNMENDGSAAVSVYDTERVPNTFYGIIDYK